MLTARYRGVGLFCAIAVGSVAAIPIIQLLRLWLKPKSRTYRVQGVPVGWTRQALRDALADHFAAEAELGMVVSPIFRGVSGKDGVATVTFKNTPQKLQKLKTGRLHKIAEQQLTLDHDFYNLTVLHAPREEDHKVEKQKDGEHMWPRDALPYDLAGDMARVMTYGYESSLFDKYSAQNISDIAESFGSNLTALLREGDTEPKPIIFIGHSMGGLVIKKTLIWLSESTEAKAACVFRAARGIAFFGVPHFGMKIDSVVPMVGTGANAPLIQSLSADNSLFLRELEPRFNKLLDGLVSHQMSCVHFYETEQSPTAKMNFLGWWSGNGERQLLVSTFSAASLRKGDISLPIKRTHSDMVKFFGRQDSEWKKVVGLLRELVSSVQKSVQEALEQELKIQYESAREACQISLMLREEHISSRSHRLEKERLPGTCEWLLCDKGYVKWKDAQNQEPSSILLLKGKPGSGKSVLMRAAVEDCTRSGSITLSFFFDGRAGSADHDQSVLTMYKVMLLQLLLRLTRSDLVDLEPTILQHSDKDGSWSTKGVWEAISTVLNRLKCDRLFVFIDALDECANQNMSSLPSFVTAMLHGRCVRLCVSSRTAGPFFVFDRRSDTAMIDVASHNKADVDELIVAGLQELQLHTTRPLVFEQMTAMLSSRASGVILWAKLVLQHIGEQELSSARADHELISHIEHLDGELTSLYRYLISKTASRDHTQACSLMLLIQVAKRPLSPDEIRSMLECSEGKPGDLKSADIAKRIQSLSGGLVECHERSGGYRAKTQTTIVQHMHKTVGDFLIHDAGLGSLDARFNGSDTEARFHSAASELCLRALSCKLDTDGNDAAIPFVSYAALFWTMHAQQGEAAIDEEQDGSYPDFLDDCGSFDAQQVARLFKEHDHYRHYKAFADKDVPVTGRLRGETSILLFLAFAGCTKLVARHLANCPSCQSPSTPNRARNLHQAFFLASHRGFHATAEAILTHPVALAAGGIDIDAAPDGDDDDITALFSCCVFGHAATADLLLRRGADPLKRLAGHSYELPLHAAAAHAEPDVVEVVLRHCRGRGRALVAAVLAAQRADGCTVFHLAVAEGRSRALDILLQEAARVPGDDVLVRALTQGDEDGDTAYDLAVMYRDQLEEEGSIQVAADAKSLAHAIARFESLMRANNIEFS